MKYAKKNKQSKQTDMISILKNDILSFYVMGHDYRKGPGICWAYVCVSIAQTDVIVPGLFCCHYLRVIIYAWQERISIHFSRKKKHEEICFIYASFSSRPEWQLL